MFETGSLPGWRWRRGATQAFFTTRAGGVSATPRDSLNLGLHVGDDATAVAENRRRVSRHLGLLDVRCATQVHGRDVLVNPGNRWGSCEAHLEADSLVTGERGTGLAVMVADCIPLVLASEHAVAAVHVGWRGLVGGIVEDTLAVLRGEANLGPDIRAGEQVAACAGPSIGPCCFEVGEELAGRFAPTHVLRRPGLERPYVDLLGAVRARLERAGVPLEAVDVCTSCDTRCFSHRRDDGRSGRQALVVWRA